MRICLAGTRSFGAAVYEQVRDIADVVQVVAPPGDKVAGIAARRNTPCFSEVPETLLGVDLLIAAHCHAFIPETALASTTLGGIGYHPSLLPRHRGRDAVRWTIHMGDPIAGGSVYWLNSNVDGGPIALQDWLHVHSEWDHKDLWERLFTVGVELIAKTVADLVAGGPAVQVPQDEELATWEPSWSRPPIHRPYLPEIGGSNVTADPAKAKRR